MVTKAQRAAMEKDVAAQRAKRGAAKPAGQVKRKYTRRATKNVEQHVENVQPNAEHANFETLFDGVQLPSVSRVVAGMVLGVLTSGAIGYGIGMLMTYALAGIATLTGSMLVAFTLSVLVWVIGIYAAWKIGGYVGSRVFASVVMPDGLAAKSYESLCIGARGAKQRVLGWFGDKPAVEQFSGAHVAA